MSQVAAKRKLALVEERVRVTARFLESGSVLAGTKEGQCKGFEIELSIDSPEPIEEILALIRQAHRMCFTEAALSGQVALTSRHRVNGTDVSGQV